MNLVVFHDHGCHILDPLLEKGFRHCFAAVQTGDYWVTIDGKAGIPSVDVVCAKSYDLKSFYDSHGFTVTEVGEGQPLTLPLVLSNCVGMVKSVLGIRAPFAVTPYQLYRRLIR